MVCGWINPGLVVSDMVIRQAREMDPGLWRSGRKVFNLFGESVDDTAEALAPRILDCQSNGSRIHLLPRRKMLGRLLTATLGGRDILAQHGI